VARPGGQDVVETFASAGADPAFREPVGSRRPRGGWMMLRFVLVNTAPNTSLNLLSRSRIRNRNCAAWSPRSISRFLACWATLVPWVGGDAGDARPPGFVLDNDEQAEEDGVKVGEVDGEDGLGVRGEELVPGRSRPERSWIDSGGLQDLPHGRRSDQWSSPVSSPWYRWNCRLRSRPTTRSSPDAAATGITRPARGGCGSRLPRRGRHALPEGVRCFASPGSLSRDREGSNG
jgi:hypothetical protein